MRRIRAGFVGFGEVNSPKELIESKCLEAKKLLEKNDMEIIYTEPVSDDPDGIGVKRAITNLSGRDFDFLVVCVAGWIPSYTVISVISEFYHKPMVLWGLAGYYKNGRLVTTADQAGAAALRKVMEDMGYNFKYVYNTPDSKPEVEKILSFAKAARAARFLKGAKIGMMGYRDMNLYGTMFEGVSLRGKIGVEIEIFEMLEIVQKLERFSESDIRVIVEKMEKEWEFEKPAAHETLEAYAKYFLSIKEKVQERGYEAISLKDVDGMKKLVKLPPSAIFMLLSDELGLCTIPENDSLGSVTQLMTKYLTGQVAAYLEFYEFMEDRVLMGVPDYVPSEVVEGKVKVNPTSFGGFSEGLLNVSKIKTGRVTLCRLTNKGDKYSMHIVTGEAVMPRSWEEAGWAPPAPQLPSLEIILDVPVDDFAEKVLSQHYIVSYGDNYGLFKDLCKILDIEVI